MRILFVAYWFPYPIWGGAVRRAHDLLRRLSERHEVHLVCLTNPYGVSPEREEVRHLFTTCCDLRYPARHSLVRVARSFMEGVPYQVLRSDDRGVRERLQSVVRETDFDLVYVDHTFLARYLPDLPGPQVAFFQNLESRILQGYARAGGFRRRAYGWSQVAINRRFERNLANRVDGVVFASRVEQSMIARELPEVRSCCVPCAVETGDFAPRGIDVREHHVAFCGSFAYHPNIEAVDFLVDEVLPRLRETIPDVSVDVIGSEPPPSVRARASSTIRVTGRVDDIIPLVERASAFVVPLLNGAGTKFKLVEALALEKAVVTTSVGADGLPIQSDRHALIANGAEAFAEALRRVLTTPELRRTLGQAGRKIVLREHSWDVLFPRIERFFVETVQRYESGRVR